MFLGILFVLCLASACVQKAYEQEVEFILDVTGIPDIESVGIRGNSSPLNWKSDLKMEVSIPDSLYTVKTVFYTGYTFTQIKFVINDRYELEEKPNRDVFFDKSRKTIFKAKFNQSNN